jgi:hypothetical protein
MQSEETWFFVKPTFIRGGNSDIFWIRYFKI